MNCLIDFLTDEKQKSLINMVQNRDETFEDELESYMKLFLVGKKYHITCVESCRNRNKESCFFPDACENIKNKINNLIENEKKENEIMENDGIEYFFKGIKYCYNSWIDSRTTIALEAFDALLKEYKLISDGEYDERDDLLIHNLTERVFFRGRITEQFLGKMDMFHVPFNRRYNLRNERFSLTGQPVLYLGNSVADIVEELELDINNPDSIKNLKISSFEFLEQKTKKKIFDLRCNIWNDIKKNRFSSRTFYRNILAIICSFQKRKGLEEYAFKEEYVIPQMLSQVLNQNNYDGICYYSTRQFPDYHLEKDTSKTIEEERKMLFRENIAVFTKKGNDPSPSPSYQFFDYNLRGSLEISMPIGVRNTKKDLENELFNVHQSIKEIFVNNNSDHDNDKNENTQKKANSIMDFYNLVFAKLKIGNQDYKETEIGKIHLQLLVGILNRILVESKDDHGKLQLPPESENSDLPDEKIQCCDFYGNDTEIKNAKIVYEDGDLHKGKIIFIIHKSKHDSTVNIAISKNKWNTLFYGSNDSVEKQVIKQKMPSINHKKKIGTFMHYDFSTIEWPGIGIYPKKIFEFVEIYLGEVSDLLTDSREIEWFSLSKLITELTKEYPKFSTVYQQALPILINYLHGEEQKKESYEKDSVAKQ